MCVGPCFMKLYLVSFFSFAVILSRNRKLFGSALIVFWLSRRCLYCKQKTVRTHFLYSSLNNDEIRSMIWKPASIQFF